LSNWPPQDGSGSDPWSQGGDPTPPPAGPPPSSYPPPAAPPPSSYPPQAPGAYGASPYGAAPYGSPYQPGYTPPQEHPKGTQILVLGILGFVCCGLLGPVAWIQGNSALKEIDAAPWAYSNRGNVQAGRIMGMIVTILFLLGIAFYAVLIVLAVATGDTSTY
jgi:hypothetical protein